MIGAITIGILGMALLYDPSGTVKFTAIALGIRGVTWLIEKVVTNINHEHGQIIDFTGWGLAGVSIVGIIKNAFGAVGELKQLAENVGGVFDKLVYVVDKITFWN